MTDPELKLPSFAFPLLSFALPDIYIYIYIYRWMEFLGDFGCQKFVSCVKDIIMRSCKCKQLYCVCYCAPGGVEI